jgi:hypothetical protein
MAKKGSQSVRARRQAHQEQRRRRQQLLIVFGGAAVALIVALLVWVNNTDLFKTEIVLPDTLEPPANADGKAWGPVNAPVLIEEFSDFQ